MAKIDFSKIEGFAGMTAEQKLAALEAYDLPDPDYSGYVKKDVYDKTASDLAEWKKKHNALLSEEEQKRLASEEELTTLRQRVEQMEREKQTSDYTARFLELGYDATLAAQSAQAMAAGDAAGQFAGLKKFLEAHDKAYKATLLGQTPTPPAGAPDPGMTLEKLRALPQDKRMEYAQSHPEQYQQLYEGRKE